MKKIFRIFAIALAGAFAIGLTACDKTKPDDEIKDLVVSADSVSFNADGSATNTNTITVTDADWSASVTEGEDWITISPTEGAAGGSFTVTVTATEGEDARQGKITVTNSKKAADKKVINVEQQGKEGEIKDIVVSADSVLFDADGNTNGTNTVTVTDSDWSASVTEGGEWITISPAEGAAGGSFTITVLTTEEEDTREGKITVTNSLKPADQKVITVEQEGKFTKPADAIEILHASGQFWYDYYKVGASNFDMTLYTSDFDDFGGRIGDGYRIAIDFLSEDPENERFPEIASGIYNITDTKEKYTVIAGEYVASDTTWLYTFVREIKDGNYTGKVLAATGGTMEIVNRGGGNYMMNFELILSDNSTLKLYYNDYMRVVNPKVLSTLTDDVVVPTLVQGMLSFMSDEGGYQHILSLQSEGYNPYAGEGYVVSLHAYTANTGNYSVLTSGTYTFSDTHDAGTMGPGYLSGSYILGSWYRKMKDGNPVERAPFITGQAEVVYNDDRTYDITFDALDDIGYNITGDFHGPLRFQDLR